MLQSIVKSKGDITTHIDEQIKKKDVAPAAKPKQIDDIYDPDVLTKPDFVLESCRNDYICPIKLTALIQI